MFSLMEFWMNVALFFANIFIFKPLVNAHACKFDSFENPIPLARCRINWQYIYNRVKDEYECDTDAV